MTRKCFSLLTQTWSKIFSTKTSVLWFRKDSRTKIIWICIKLAREATLPVKVTSTRFRTWMRFKHNRYRWLITISNKPISIPWKCIILRSMIWWLLIWSVLQVYLISLSNRINKLLPNKQLRQSKNRACHQFITSRAMTSQTCEQMSSLSIIFYPSTKLNKWRQTRMSTTKTLELVVKTTTLNIEVSAGKDNNQLWGTTWS